MLTCIILNIGAKSLRACTVIAVWIRHASLRMAYLVYGLALHIQLLLKGLHARCQHSLTIRRMAFIANVDPNIIGAVREQSMAQVAICTRSHALRCVMQLV